MSAGRSGRSTRLPDLEAILRGNPWIAAVLDRFATIALPDAWLVAGGVVQTVWNHRFALPPTTGINDLDLVYFDPDLAATTEAAHAARLQALFADLPVWLDVKNQARVHLWYPAKFGVPLAPFRSTAEAIATYPTTATATGVRMHAGRFEVCAPFGLADLQAGIIRPNRVLVTEAAYTAKVTRWRSQWPGLHVLPWAESRAETTCEPTFTVGKTST